MNIQQFTKWLRSEISALADDSPDGPDESQHYEAAGIIREARRVALSLGLPDVAEICSLRTPALGLPTAQKILSECLAKCAIQQSDFTPPEIAQRLGVNPGKVLSFIRRGEMKAINVSQGNRPRYRITLEELEAFRRGRSVNPPPKRVRKSAYRGKEYY